MRESGEESPVAFLSQLQPSRLERRGSVLPEGGGGRKSQELLFLKALSEAEKVQGVVWRGQGITRNQRWIRTPESRATETSLQVRTWAHGHPHDLLVS